MRRAAAAITLSRPSVPGMANPAALLLAQFEAWDTTGTQHTPATRRGFSNDISETLRRHEIAMTHIAETRELLDAVETAGIFPVDEYRSELATWTTWVLSYPDGWQPQMPGRMPPNFGAFNNTSMRLLRTLVAQLDRLVPTFEEDQRQSFADHIDDLVSTLKGDPSVRGSLAEYMLSLIIHMKHVLAEYDLRGDFALSRALLLLKGTVFTAADVSTHEPSKPKWEWLKAIFTWSPKVAEVAIEWNDVFKQLGQ